MTNCVGCNTPIPKGTRCQRCIKAIVDFATSAPAMKSRTLKACMREFLRGGRAK